QFDRDLVLTVVLNRPLQNDLMSIDFGAEFVSDPVHNVLRSDGSKRFSGLTSLQAEYEPRFADSTRQVFRLIQLARFALGSLLLESIEFAQCAWRDLVCFPAWQKIIARITAAHFYHVGLSTESGHIFS